MAEKFAGRKKWGVNPNGRSSSFSGPTTPIKMVDERVTICYYEGRGWGRIKEKTDTGEKRGRINKKKRIATKKEMETEKENG